MAKSDCVCWDPFEDLIWQTAVLFAHSQRWLQFAFMSNFELIPHAHQQIDSTTATEWKLIESSKNWKINGQRALRQTVLQQAAAAATADVIACLTSPSVTKILQKDDCKKKLNKYTLHSMFNSTVVRKSVGWCLPNNINLLNEILEYYFAAFFFFLNRIMHAHTHQITLRQTGAAPVINMLGEMFEMLWIHWLWLIRLNICRFLLFAVLPFFPFHIQIFFQLCCLSNTLQHFNLISKLRGRF